MLKKKFFSLKRIICLVLAVTTLAFFTGCNGKNYISANYFKTEVYVQVGDGRITDQLHDKITSFLSALEKEVSVTNPDSAISRFNAGENAVLLSSDCTEILAKSFTAYELFEKKFNPALYPLSVKWQFSPEYPVSDFTPPENSDLLSIDKTSLDFNNVLLDSQTNTLSKLYADIQIDLGGIAKGYASQKVGEMLVERGFKLGYVSVGSSSLYVISADKLSVRHPENKGAMALEINLKNQKNLCVSTSGSYERYYQFDGKTYCHIIDGETLSPADTGVLSATVIVDDGSFADALSTALCLCSHSPNDLENSELVNFIKNMLVKKQFENAQFFVFYNRDGIKQLLTNKKQNENFVLSDTSYSVVDISL